MSSVEIVLYDISLPNFISRFRINCINYLVTPIDSVIAMVEQLNDPILFILLVILILQLLRVALVKDNETKDTSNAASMQAISK